MPVFLHAVASFEPRETGVLLWTRLTGATSASWVLARDPEFADIVDKGEAETGPERDHTITVDVSGLDPATTYWYRFEAAGETSPIGRTRTLPDGGHVRIGLVGCARYSVAPLGVYRALAEREVDVVIHLGDYIYEDDGAKGVREHEPPRTCVTLGDYRQRLAQHRRDPDCQALHLRHPMSLIVDDHDVADNCWTTGAKAHDADEHGDWDIRARAATQARQEWVPSRLRDASDPRQTWRGFPVGDVAEVLLLDTRLSGRDQQAGDEVDGQPGRHDPERSLLGDEQRAWLTERLHDTSRPWAIVASGVVVNEVTLPFPAAAGLIQPFLPNGYAAMDGEILHDDQWDGYTAERDRLVAAMQQRGDAGGQTLLLSGDIHSSWAFEGPCNPESREPVSVEFTVPATSSKPMGRSRVPGAWRLLDASVRRIGNVPWADVTERGYAILDLSRDSATMAFWFVEPTSRDPHADERLAAAFRVRRSSWPPHVERLEDGDVPLDPEREVCHESLPPRPDDLAKMRRSHFLRMTVARSIGAGVPTALALSALLRRRRT